MAARSEGEVVEKISFVRCPRCQGEYYIERSDYVNQPEALCHCPFCGLEFPALEGNPRPPLTGAPGRG